MYFFTVPCMVIAFQEVAARQNNSFFHEHSFLDFSTGYTRKVVFLQVFSAVGGHFR